MLLVVFSALGPGPWRVQVGDPGPVTPNQETGWDTPPPAPSFTPPTLLGLPDYSQVESGLGVQGVEVTDTRNRQLAGAYTAGELRYSVRHDAGPGFTYLDLRSRHEGAGEYESRLSTLTEESASGPYVGARPALSERILRQTGIHTTLDVAFRPTYDANTTIQLEMMTVPLPSDVPRIFL